MRPLALLLVVLSACRPAAERKQPSLDFDAIPLPTAAEFSREADLLSRWNDVRADSLRDFWNSGEAGTFDGVNGIDVAYRRFRVANAKGTIVVTPGRTEAIIKYAEVAYDLTRQGYSVATLTLRGQGEAQRILSDPHKGYVDYFDDYVEDVHTFLSTIVRPDSERVFLLSHSLSGGVATLVVDEYPNDVDALALSAPMLEIDLGAFPAPVAATLGLGVCDGTDGSGWAIGSGAYKREESFQANTVTSSEARWTWKVQQLDDDESIRLGGLTWRWLCQALEGSSRGVRTGAYSGVPTLMLIAGGDTFVKPGGQRQYCGIAGNCLESTLPDAKHEILQERDELRNEALSRIVKFFNSQVNP